MPQTIRHITHELAGIAHEIYVALTDPSRCQKEPIEEYYDPDGELIEDKRQIVIRFE